MQDANPAHAPDNRNRRHGNEDDHYHKDTGQRGGHGDRPSSGLRRVGSGRSATSIKSAGSPFADTVERELSGFSSTARMTHEDIGRIVSPPASVTPKSFKPSSRQKQSQKSNQRQKPTKQELEQQRQLMEMQMTTADENLREIMMSADTVQRDLKNELERKKTLQRKYSDADLDIKELNEKIAAIRVKLGVANANFNVSKTESEQLRRQFQEAQVKKARLDERIKTATADLARLTDPDNPESYVNMKSQVDKDRKDIKRLKTELEGVRGERSDVQKQNEEKEAKVQHLTDSIAEVTAQLNTCQGDLDVADVSAEAERKEREDIEVKYNQLLGEKIDYDEQLAKFKSRITESVDGKSAIQKQAESYRLKEHVIHDKILRVEKHLRETFTELEQLKNARMPMRTASSIKYHQFRMYGSGIQQMTSTSTKIDLGSKSVYSLGIMKLNRATSKGSGGSLGSKGSKGSRYSNVSPVKGKESTTKGGKEAKGAALKKDPRAVAKQ